MMSWSERIAGIERRRDTIELIKNRVSAVDESERDCPDHQLMVRELERREIEVREAELEMDATLTGLRESLKEETP